MLQADSDNECQAWINAIQAGVTNAYRDASSESDSQMCNHGNHTMSGSASASSLKSQQEAAALPNPPR